MYQYWFAVYWLPLLVVQLVGEQYLIHLQNLKNTQLSSLIHWIILITVSD
jgi:hypothetical protein